MILLINNIKFSSCTHQSWRLWGTFITNENFLPRLLSFSSALEHLIARTLQIPNSGRSNTQATGHMQPMCCTWCPSTPISYFSGFLSPCRIPLSGREIEKLQLLHFLPPLPPASPATTFFGETLATQNSKVIGGDIITSLSITSTFVPSGSGARLL